LFDLKRIKSGLYSIPSGTAVIYEPWFIGSMNQWLKHEAKVVHIVLIYVLILTTF